MAELQPVLELMRTFFFSIGSMDTPEQARHKIALRLEAAGMTSPADAELFNEFLGVSESTDAVSSLNAKARRGKLLAAVRELMRHDAATPSVVLIEDLHWLDEASEEFVAALVDAAAGTRTMLVLNYRSSYRSPWAQRQNFRELELAELSAADELADASTGNDLERKLRDAGITPNEGSANAILERLKQKSAQ